MDNQKILFSGIQPSNRLTIGNYLGAIKSMVQLQKQYQTILFVADLHARTVPMPVLQYDYQQLEKFKWETVKMYCACGIDIMKTRVFYQSNISSHLELFYFILTHSSLGELKRMTQYKFLVEKLKQPNQTNVELMGVLIYPVLMAADILLYDADFVAVGQDQQQHLELVRELVKRINQKYQKPLFKSPESLGNSDNDSFLKIMDLQDPSKKMSKSTASELGVIFLNDDPEIAKEKILKSKTDSLNKVNVDPVNQPGIFNLLTIYSEINQLRLEESCLRFKDSDYKSFKIAVAESVVSLISSIQQKYDEIDEKKLQESMLIHTWKCRQMAQKKMDYIYNCI